MGLHADKLRADGHEWINSLVKWVHAHVGLCVDVWMCVDELACRWACLHWPACGYIDGR